MENRRDVLKLAGLALASGSPLFAGPKAAIPNEVVASGQAKLTQQSFGDIRVFFDGTTGQLKGLTAGSLLLKPGMEPHPPHQHPEEEIMLVTEGEGEILVDGKTVKVGPGSMMYCEGNQLHGIKNTSAAPLLFYYYKWLA
jgi:quercetin dioxygenase-like cupin family protein